MIADKLTGVLVSVITINKAVFLLSVNLSFLYIFNMQLPVFYNVAIHLATVIP